ncbi:tubulin-tyrosine ligase activity [Nesidiocoris tenuis]|uniref:Tubulin-tyrosine ligase activity n=1 Tax=Nesidiocoris tenuis TaxID=355587 RepID=A0ABN7B3K0_9HEMI|nr:tubulin-tyrosine ligase activity [Nesidiocoris tenuis]
MSRKQTDLYDYLDRPFSPSDLDNVNHRVNTIYRPKVHRTKKKHFNPKLARICTTTCRFPLVKTTAHKYGMKDVAEWQDWHVYWTDVFPSLERCRLLKRYQRINHFPGMLEICRKDALARNLKQMLKLFPKEYNFFPKTWCLPEDSVDMYEYARNNPGKTYILKPCRGSEGRGISLTKNPKDFRTRYRMIGQVYISKPLLIGGFKFDFRIYVLVTSCDPLRIYVYNEGLARFATKKYEPSKSNLAQKFMHLTNYSVNKRSEDFIIDDDEGSKRKLSSINKMFVKAGFDVDQIWDSIDDVIVKTMLIVLPKLKHYYRLCFPNHVDTLACFEVLGFDFILDSRLKPFLLEVNYTPSFNRNTPVDRQVKDALLSDVFKLIDLSRNEKSRIEESEQNAPQVVFNKKKEMAKKKLRQEKTLKARMSWEDEHLGNFRKVYPCAEMNWYKPFLKIKQNQIFPKTQVPLITEDDYERQKDNSPPKVREVRRNPFIVANPNIRYPSNADHEKLKRHFLLSSHDVVQNLYENIKQSGKRRLEQEVALCRNNCWNMEQFENEYRTCKDELTTGITTVLKAISSEVDIPPAEQEELSSIFLNPSALKNATSGSHIGPIGPEMSDTLVEDENGQN